MYKKYIEDPHYRLLKKYPDFMGKGHVLDVGANIGYTAILFARHLSTGYKVYAFEPEKLNFNFLNYNIKKAGYEDRIETLNCAVSDGQNKHLILTVNKVHPGDHRIAVSKDCDLDSQTVESIFIDYFTSTLLRDKEISMIKIDAQGHEMQVCQGMHETLAANPKVNISIEVSESDQVNNIFSFFASFNFTPFVLGKDLTFKKVSINQAQSIIKSNSYVDLYFSSTDLATKYSNA